MREALQEKRSGRCFLAAVIGRRKTWFMEVQEMKTFSGGFFMIFLPKKSGFLEVLKDLKRCQGDPCLLMSILVLT